MEKFIFHELPFFSGTQNVVEWIDTVERVSSFGKWNDEELRKVARLKIRGGASEFVSHLELEDKANTWTALKKLLVDRYGSKGQEQLNQYLLSTSQQRDKTVQEWAQVVRKLSLNSLTDLDREPYLEMEQHGTDTANQTVVDERRVDPNNDGEGIGPDASQTTSITGLAMNKEIQRNHEEEMKKLRKRKERLLLDHMRRVNFVRGLRPDLRRAVLQRGCITFDKAVEAAQREENLNMAVGQEELLNSMCVQGEVRKNPDVKDVAIAVVQMLDEREKDRTTRIQEDRSSRPTIPLPEISRHRETQGCGASDNFSPELRELDHYRSPNRRSYRQDEYSRYNGGGRRQQQYNTKPFYDGSYQPSRRDTSQRPAYYPAHRRHENYRLSQAARRGLHLQKRADMDRNACFYCHQQGHIIKHCEARREAYDQQYHQQDTGSSNQSPSGVRETWNIRLSAVSRSLVS